MHAQANEAYSDNEQIVQILLVADKEIKEIAKARTQRQVCCSFLLTTYYLLLTTYYLLLTT